MKKIILLTLMFFIGFIGFAQLPTLESFDNGIPTDWAVFDNSVGTAQGWGITNVPANVYSAPNSAEVLRENIGAGNTSEDWLVTSLQALPPNAQFRFYTRSQLTGDNGTLYQIRISSTSQTDVSTFTTIQTYTELELSTIANVYEEKVLSLATYSGTNKYIAFVRVHTQAGGSTTGDKWLLDNVSIVEQCPNPTLLSATNITADSAVLGWASTASGFDIQYGPSGFTLGTGTIVTGVTNPYTATNLTPSTPYQFYVKAFCAGGTTFSEWTGPFNFTTKNLGSVCDDPIVIAALPYQVALDNTANYGDDINGAQGTLCGAVPTSTNYLAGDDVFYTYTATADGPISITMTPQGATSTNSSVFVYGTCAAIGTSCLAGVANSGVAPRIINMTLTAGQTIVIVISSSATTQTISYSLVIQDELCTPKPTALTASNFTLTSADLSWTSTYTTAQVSVQPLGSAIPSGAGVAVTGTTYTDNTLTAATQYQYWVRGECSPGSGTYTAWAGPYAFNTALCNAVDQCNYTFRMTDSSNNGWNGARMEVRQNNIVLATIGATYTAGAGPVDIVVPMCNNLPFDLYWSVSGTQPQQCIVAVINSFGQTIYTKAAGVAGQGDVVYAGTVNCTTPQCDIAPINVTATNIANYTATIGWTAPATTAWDVYLVPTGTPPPLPSTIPTYANITTNPLDVSGLIADNTYCVYVRVVCSPFPSPWSAVYCFTTLPTCPKPTALTVPAATITTTSAVVTWVNGIPTDTEWEILLVKAVASNSYGTPPPPAVVPVLLPGDKFYTPTTTPPSSASPYTATGLEPATIYYYYIRTICSATDKSTWSGPIKFNTVTCDVADKCNYKFVMTDTGTNGWQGARMQVQQNGIVIATIGSTITGAGPTTVTVALCNNVPIELLWTIPGTAPEEIGLTIQNPFTDIIYTMVPGTVTPPTGTPIVPVSVYNTIGNCTPPSCPKPTALAVNAAATTQTSAELSWTAGGTETQWEIYVVTVGSPPPVNGTPVSGVAPYYIANTNPYIVTGLLPGTAYIYYVRAICSPTDVGTWTIVNPKTFTTKAVNDECITAIVVPVNPTQVCVENVAGSTLGATNSMLTITGAGCGTSDDDVWFSFTAINDIQIIDLNNIVGSSSVVALNHTLFSGACDALVKLYCSTATQSVATGLTIGQTYYVRVYTAGSAITQYATFNICIQTPPPPATNDECATAIVAVVNSNAGCSVTTPGNIIGATGSLPPTACSGNENDDVWFSFVATSSIQYFSLLNVAGTTTDLNHAIYSGVCGSLVQLSCSPANSLNSNYSNFVIGQTYYIRIWSNSAASQVVTFDLCIKTVSTCENAEPFCGSSPTDPYIFANTVGVLPGAGQIACLFTTPNPTYYTLHVGQTGPLYFNIFQSEGFDAAGNPTGNLYDVDYVAWGPFTSPESCAEITFGPCAPIACPNNTTDPSFYPSGNIVDCSYSGSYTESLSIPNAVSGEFYIILITNYSQEPGFIRLVQTNYEDNGAGDTVCCDVDLGPDQSLCATSVTLNAIQGLDPDNVPTSFVWYFNNTIIPGETTSTYEATVSGVYKVSGTCGLNAVEDEMTLILGPIIGTIDPVEDAACDDISNDGIASFNLQALIPTVLGPLNPASFVVTYYLTELDATNGTSSIDISVPFVNTTPFSQTIYARVESIALSVCFEIAPVQLVVTPLANASFTYSSNEFCTTAANPLPIFTTGIAGQFTATPNGLIINIVTGAIDLAASAAGDYVVSNTIAANAGCSEVISTFDLTITAPALATFNYGSGVYCKNGGFVSPIFVGNGAVAGTFTVVPLTGLSINTSTGVVDLANSVAGSYLVTNTTLAQGSCLGDVQSSTIQITEPATGTISYNSPFCLSTAGIQNVISTAPTGGVYSSEDGLSIDALTGAINPSESTSGNYTVNYFIAAAQGCEDFSTGTDIVIIPASTISILSGCDGNDYQLSAVQGNGSAFETGASFLWVGPNIPASEVNLATITISSSGTYTVTVTTTDGCSNAESISPTDISCTIQKGISPDNDGKNDFFDLSTLNVKQLSIYNRYGMKVYSLSNYTKQWYGTTDDGKELPDGTYYYVIERDNVEAVTGWIYIIHQNK